MLNEWSDREPDLDERSIGARVFLAILAVITAAGGLSIVIGFVGALF